MHALKFLVATIMMTVTDAAAQTLDEALANAFNTNPTLLAERARFRAIKEERVQALSGVLPTIEATGSYGRLDDKTTFNAATFSPGAPSVKIDSKLDPVAAQIEFSQPLFSGFRNLNAIKAAAARVRAGGARLAAAEQSALLAAANAYFDVVRDEQIYAANANQVDVLKRQTEEAQARLRVGEVTKTDVAQAEARSARARAGLALAQSSLSASRATFAETVGQEPQSLERDPKLPEAPQTPDQALETARLLSPRLIAARQASEAARRQIAIARAALAPTVSAVASYSHTEDQSSLLQRSDQTFYGVRARVPIFSGGLSLSRIREAKAQADAARAEMEEAERRVVAETTAAYGRLIAARQASDAARAQIAANRLALDGVRREREVGARTTLDVLDAEQEVLNAETTLASAERDARTATFSLLAAIGALTSESLGVTQRE